MRNAVSSRDTVALVALASLLALTIRAPFANSWTSMSVLGCSGVGGSSSTEFLVFPNGERLAHVTSLGRTTTPGIIFLNGFRSSMDGQKALQMQDYCRETQRSFTRFDYRGHGSSSGHFIDSQLSDWIQDTLFVLDNVVDVGTVVLVGSSMGAWIALHVAMSRPDRVAGIVGIAAAPDFIVQMYNGLSLQDKLKLQETGIVQIASQYSPPDEPYPITRQLVEDSKSWNLLDKQPIMNSIPITCPVRLLHGLNDEDVPFETSLKLAQAVSSENVELCLIKDGNHRLSRSNDLKRLTRVVNDLVQELEEEST